MMKLRTVEDADISGKTILYRAPYDIEVKEVNGALEVYDDMRIRATLPTLEYLLKQNCKIVILTYVGRPDGIVVEKLRTTPHARKLEELLHHPVTKLDDCIGEEVERKIAAMQPGDIIMLENVRFYSEEMMDNDGFAQKLCNHKDFIVFDGFPQAHRKHASTTGILRHLPSAAGFYVLEEFTMLSNLLENPLHPFTIIIGGAKISDKVDAIRNLLPRVDTVIVGGAVANVFLRAQGRELGDSFIEDVFVDKVKRQKEDWVKTARGILDQAVSLGKRVVTPTDAIVFDGTTTKIIDITKESIPEGSGAFDIGPDSKRQFAQIISESKMVFVNGPMGKFEDEKFSHGSEALFTAIKSLDKNSHKTILAGGDTIDAARLCSSVEDYSHVSLAGGATLEFLAGKELPALTFLMKE